MKKQVLATAAGLVLAGACANAGAVTLNPKGLGQVLLFPYYTVNKGQDTLLSVVNVSDVGKAVHVRFHEGYNGRVVMDFLVFLSPHDVWTAGVTTASDSATGGARLVSSDRSCTLPQIPAGGIAFSSVTYSGASASDGGPQAIERTREGHVQIITDGDIRPDSPTARIVEHVQTGAPGAGAPADCSQLDSASVVADLVAPANTLAGSAGIVNVDEGTYFPYNAEAISDFTRVPLLTSLSVVDADDLRSANSDSADGGVPATVFVDGKPLTFTYARGVDAVSALFMADSIYNEVLLTQSLNAATDWILTFPTKRFYVDPGLEPEAPALPFGEAFQAPGEAAARGMHYLYDAEELYVSDPCGQVCGTPVVLPPLNMPYEVTAVAFHRGEEAAPTVSPVFGSRLLRTLAPTYPGWQTGWARLDFAYDEQQSLPGGTANGGSRTLFGLPVTGFMAYNIVNTQAQPGRLANYSGLFRHRSTASCLPSGVAPAPDGSCF